MKGAPEPEKLEADWPPIPLELGDELDPKPLFAPAAAEFVLEADPNVFVELESVGEPPGAEPAAAEPVLPVPEPNGLVPDPFGDIGLDPDPLPDIEVDPLPIPVDASPASGWPKKPLTIVLFSPTLIRRQSDLPVMGSLYFCRMYLMLLVFSSCSMEPGKAPVLIR